MKQYLFKAMGSLAFFGMLSGSSFAQQKSSDKPGKLDENEVIIIKKKSDKKSKVTVEINGEDVKINGKPLADFKNDDLSVEIESDGPGIYGVPGPRSPFRKGGTTIYASDRPFLGVMTEDDENGAKVTSVTKGSGAEKAGLKEGDVIKSINSTQIKSPAELTETVAKLKPEDKVTITVLRNKKEEKLTASLGRRPGGQALYSPGFDFDQFNMNMDMNNGAFALAGRPRLGIKAQDTEEGKGVKVLEVDDESNAEKAGIEEGDIIVEFDGKPVNSATELSNAAREAREKNPIKVKLTRDGKAQDIEIKIPKKLKTANL